MDIKMIEVGKLKPYENNPRKNNKSVDAVANSIKEFGFKVPIVIDKNNVIVAGHTRYMASKKLGIEKVPCIVADDLNEQQIKAFRLADNKVGENSEWDLPQLDLELLNIEEIDMKQFGFEFYDEQQKEKAKKQKYLETMEINAFEHHDYVVFVFDNQMDWLNVVNEFGIKKVLAGYGDHKKVGVGRVINGKRLLERIRHTTDNS